MPSASSGKKRSRLGTPDDRDQRAKKHKKHTSKTSNRKRISETVEINSSSESDSGSDSDNEIGVDPAECKVAGRAIAHCYDMFADVNKVINIVLLSKQAEAAENGDLSDSEDEGTRQHRDQFLSQISTKTIARYKHVYALVLRLVPGIKLLIDDPSRSAQLKKAVKKINHAINEARSSDAAKLRDRIVSYLTPNPSVAALSPPIPAGSSRSQMGLNHPVLAGYLCPVDSVKAFHEDPEGTRKKLENGKIKMSSTDFPAFLWEDNGCNFDEYNIFEGFFRGFYLERVTRHIFTGPSTGMGGDARGSKPNNSELNHMDQVGGAQLAYAAVQARFGISSKNRWSEKDGVFNYRKYYYALADIVDDCEDVAWKEGLLKHYNILLFKDEKGRQNDAVDNDNDDTDADGSKRGLLSRMRAQAAARASSSATNSRPNTRSLTPPLTSGPHSGGAIAASPKSPIRPFSFQNFASPTNSTAGIYASPHPLRANPTPDTPAAPRPPTPRNPTPQAHTHTRPPVRESPRAIPQTHEDSPMSELSDLEQNEQKALEEKKKKTAIRRGKKKAIVVGSDEEQESSTRPRRKVSKKGKK